MWEGEIVTSGQGRAGASFREALPRDELAARQSPATKNAQRPSGVMPTR